MTTFWRSWWQLISRGFPRIRLGALIANAVIVCFFTAPVTFLNASPPPEAPTLRDFLGVNNPIEADKAKQMGIGWVRLTSAVWYYVEPSKGTWDWSKSDAAIQQAQSSGLQVLPLVAYTPEWSATVPHAKGVAPPKNAADWQDYVEHLVARYSSPPYNLRYFQVWNEPTKEAGFWLGTDQQYADMIYLPAAKIIRDHHCYVVFGGWPNNGTVQRLDALMNYHNLWQLTDIVDVHYRSINDFQQLYSQWVATGKCRGIWQTEYGYTVEPGAASGNISNYLTWALQTGWRDPNEFKIFWFAASAPDGEGEKDLIKFVSTGGQMSAQLSGQGQHLVAMAQALGQGPLSKFTDFSIQPAGAGNHAYRVGSNRVVIHFLIDRAFFNAHPSVAVSAAIGGQPSRVQLLSGLGKSSDLTAQYGGGRAQVTVPLHNGLDDCAACKAVQGYLILDK